MKCRIDIIGTKVWNDNENSYKTRPQENITVNLLRDGEVLDTAEVDPNGSGKYRFLCQPVWNGNTEYVYQIDEDEVPAGYKKRVEKYNIINTLDTITIVGTKTWDDNQNAAGKRPATITVNLLQNGSVIRTITVTTPIDQNVVPFSFTGVPFADSQDKAYVYTIDEGPVQDYQKKITGLNITNSLI